MPCHNPTHRLPKHNRKLESANASQRPSQTPLLPLSHIIPRNLPRRLQGRKNSTRGGLHEVPCCFKLDACTIHTATQSSGRVPFRPAFEEHLHANDYAAQKPSTSCSKLQGQTGPGRGLCMLCCGYSFGAKVLEMRGSCRSTHARNEGHCCLTA